MANSPNKGYVLQDVGTNAGTWGTQLNDSMISIADRNVGGVLSKNITATGDITLTNVTPTWEAQYGTLVLTGSPSYGTYTSITISTPAVGYLFVDNQITLPGGQTVYPQIRIKNSSNATYAIVPPNSKATVILDTTNGARVAGIAGVDGFAVGVSTLFFNASAPLNWTKDTTHNNKALRIVNTSGGGFAGSTAFTTVFAARTLIATNLPDHSVGVAISDPGHTHTYYPIFYSSVNTRSVCASGSSYPSGATQTGAATTGITASGSFGNTQRGGAQTSIDFNVQYVDAIICNKAY